MVFCRGQDGDRIYYEVHNNSDSSETIVFLHGVFGKGRDWKHHGYFDLLSDYNLIIVDLRGHGRSETTHQINKYDPLNQADDIYSVVTQEKCSKVIVWGYSYGARMAIAFALKYPKLVSKVVMGGMHPYTVNNVHEAVQNRQSVIKKGMEKWVNYLLEQGIKLDKYTKETLLDQDYLSLVTVDDAILAWKGFETFEILEKNNIPVFMYLGERDHSYLPHAKRFEERHVNAKLVIIPDKNHFTANFDSKDVISLLREENIL